MLSNYLLGCRCWATYTPKTRNPKTFCTHTQTHTTHKAIKQVKMKLFGKAASESVSLTPLCGGQSEGPVCSLLEIGDFCLLLDCGSASYHTDKTLFTRIHDLVSHKRKSLDAVVLSHADHYHMGALPMVLGKQGFVGTPAICTLPVYKFGQMLLYDTFLNREMEGSTNPSSSSNTSGGASNNNSTAASLLLDDLGFDLDDVDESMSRVTAVKFSQTIHLQSADRMSTISLTALPSGRTIGGSIWCIEHGESTILYAMDVNLKKELVLDGKPRIITLFVCDVCAL
jgi:cleavage and polyadenylation specificity factor subunit 2